MGTFEVSPGSPLSFRSALDQGSPVWSWRRKHRRSTPTVLPPLEQAKDLTISLQTDNVWADFAIESIFTVGSKKGLRLASNSLPPGGMSRCSTPSGSLKPLRPSSQARSKQALPSPSLPWEQGWSVPVKMVTTSHQDKTSKLTDVVSTTGHVSAMALDLMLDTKKSVSEDSKAESVEDIACDLADDDYIPGEEFGAQHWFPLVELEAQVKALREQAPVAKLPSQANAQDSQKFARGFGVEEASADGDDDDDDTAFESGVRRVRPGEYLMDPDDVENDDVVEVTDEDLAVYTAENAVDFGFYGFLMEAAALDEFGEEEEV